MTDLDIVKSIADSSYDSLLTICQQRFSIPDYKVTVSNEVASDLVIRVSKRYGSEYLKYIRLYSLVNGLWSCKLYLNDTLYASGTFCAAKINFFVDLNPRQIALLFDNISMLPSLFGLGSTLQHKLFELRNHSMVRRKYMDLDVVSEDLFSHNLLLQPDLIVNSHNLEKDWLSHLAIIPYQIYNGAKSIYVISKRADCTLNAYYTSSYYKSDFTFTSTLLINLLEVISVFQYLGIVHTDIYDKNILLFFEGTDCTKMYLSDFGDVRLCERILHPHPLQKYYSQLPPEYYHTRGSVPNTFRSSFDLWSIAIMILRMHCKNRSLFDSFMNNIIASFNKNCPSEYPSLRKSYLDFINSLIDSEDILLPYKPILIAMCELDYNARPAQVIHIYAQVLALYLVHTNKYYPRQDGSVFIQNVLNKLANMDNICREHTQGLLSLFSKTLVSNHHTWLVRLSKYFKTYYLFSSNKISKSFADHFWLIMYNTFDDLDQSNLKNQWLKLRFVDYGLKMSKYFAIFKELHSVHSSLDLRDKLFSHLMSSSDYMNLTPIYAGLLYHDLSINVISYDDMIDILSNIVYYNASDHLNVNYCFCVFLENIAIAYYDDGLFDSDHKLCTTLLDHLQYLGSNHILLHEYSHLLSSNNGSVISNCYQALFCNPCCLSTNSYAYS